MAGFAHYKTYSTAFPPDGVKVYDQSSVRAIDTFRKSFNGTLFIDRITRQVGFSEGRLYPPRGENGLKALHQKICDANIPDRSKISIMYYLLLDFDAVRRSVLADELAERTKLPKTYAIFLKGLWHMDRQQFQTAITYLAHPSLPCELADDIIIVLVRYSESRNYSLPLAYYYAAQPLLKTSEGLACLYEALARTSVSAALQFSREQPEYARQQLFGKLLATVVEEQVAGKRAEELASLPMDRLEDAWLQEYLTSGDGKGMKSSRAVLELRHAAVGRQRVPLNSLSEKVASARAGRH